MEEIGNQFTHLHVHTEYSLFDGISRIPELVARAKELEMEAIAITDHGAMYGVVEFYAECKEQEIKPIIGCELYVADGDHRSRDADQRHANHHLTVLAQDNEGYGNLTRLVTKAHLEGYYGKPRVDFGLLEQHNGGLICLSGCPSGELQKALKDPDGNIQEAMEIAGRYREVFGDRYWLEIQKHRDVPDLDRINANLMRLAEKTQIGLVATNDPHYIRREHAKGHDLYLAMQTQENIHNEERLSLKDDSYYLKSGVEMTATFPECPWALDNSVHIGRACNVGLNFDRKDLPEVHKPEGMSSEQYLRQLCEEGFDRLCPPNDGRYRKRLEYELEVIEQTHFADYFLIVWDIIRFARDREILLAVRGSAAASLVLYCLNITVADPIRHDLVFERFLNLERREMPDIDMDFQDDRRDEVMNYVVDKYGRENVAQIVTFTRYGVKSALRSGARAMGIDHATAARVAKAAPEKAATIADALKANPEMERMGRNDERIKALLENTQGLEGIVTHTSSHAAAVVIASEPLAEITPVQLPHRSKEGEGIHLTQYSMDPIAKLGLLKMDLLGLTSLTILDRTIRMIDDGPAALDEISLDDGEVYKLLGTGNTSNVFQLESDGMQRYIRELKPSDLGDIAAMIALYRPGPMENIDRFIKSKHGQEKTTFPHPSMEELLAETYGVIVYQDQVLQLLQSFAGYTMGEADIVRKAMGKKIPSLMQNERTKFISMAGENGHDQKTATAIFDIIEPFAGYAFNKAHSISYALISYWTAWFKAHYPTEYMTATLNARRTENKRRYRATLLECARMRMQLKNPSVNRSQVDSATEDGRNIRLGLTTIEGVGESSVRPIVDEREKNGSYESLEDFCRRAPRIPPKHLELMIGAGALDEMAERGWLLDNLKELTALLKDEERTRESGQVAMFGLSAESSQPEWLTTMSSAQETPERDKARLEQQTLGIAISWDPAELLREKAGRGDLYKIDDIQARDKDGNNERITTVGFIREIENRKTREGKEFIVVALAVADGEITVTVWPETLEKTAGVWEVNEPVRITGTLTDREDGLEISAERAHSLDSNQQNGASGEPLMIEVTPSGRDDEDVQRFRQIMRVILEHDGPDEVIVEIKQTGTGERVAVTLDRVQADGANPTLRARLNQMWGVEAHNEIDAPKVADLG